MSAFHSPTYQGASASHLAKAERYAEIVLDGTYPAGTHTLKLVRLRAGARVLPAKSFYTGDGVGFGSLTSASLGDGTTAAKFHAAIATISLTADIVSVTAVAGSHVPLPEDTDIFLTFTSTAQAVKGRLLLAYIEPHCE
jgi:hypothetical protein